MKKIVVTLSIFALMTSCVSKKQYAELEAKPVKWVKYKKHNAPKERKFGFGVNELNGSVTGYHYQNGELLFLQNISCYGEGVKVFQSADVHCSPDGKFLYVSNRGSEENSMVIFSINQKGGKLSLVGRTSTYGEHPRSFVIAPDGQYLIVANQFTNNLVVFKRDSNTGLLTKTKTELKLDAPGSLKMFS